MGAGGKGRAGGATGDVFDVRVVAFAGGSTRTLQALQELFGLDRDAAQRLVDSVPMVVRRAAPANEAQSYVEALRGMGALVALEPPAQATPGEPPLLVKPPPVPAPLRAPPPPPKPATSAAKGAPPPVPRDAAPLPRPIMRQPTADLEFDLAGAGGTGEPARFGVPSRAEQTSPEPKSATQVIERSRGRAEIEFQDSASSKLEIDLDAVRGGAEPASIAEAGGRDAARAAAVSGARASLRIVPAEPIRGLAPMSRAAVVHKAGPARAEPGGHSRMPALLQMFAGVAILAAGVWFDSSIVYGNANLVSVLAHAGAIYLLGVGLRGMWP